MVMETLAVRDGYVSCTFEYLRTAGKLRDLSDRISTPFGRAFLYAARTPRPL